MAKDKSVKNESIGLGETVALLSAVAAGDDGSPVEQLLLPNGRHRASAMTGEHEFTLDERNGPEIVAAFNALGEEAMFDRNHEALFADSTLAAGWSAVNGLRYDPQRGLLAMVNWTPEARRQIRDREYRWLSPVVRYRDGRISGLGKRRSAIGPLVLGTLTNDPALGRTMTAAAQGGRKNGLWAALAAAEMDEAATAPGIKESAMNEELMKLLRTMLGLADDADEAAVIEALKKKQENAEAGNAGNAGGGEAAAAETTAAMSALATARDALKLPKVEGETVAALAGRVAARASQAAQDQSEIIATLTSQVTQQGEQLAALAAERLDQEIEQYVADGKLSKAEAPAYRKLAATMPREEFAALMAAKSPAVPVGDRQAAGAVGGAPGASCRTKAQEIVAACQAKARTEKTSYSAAYAALKREQPALFEED